MRATFMYGAGDVRVIDVPDPSLKHPTDALVRIVRSYNEADIGWRLFGRNVTLTGGPAPARNYIEELMPAILDGTIEPGRVFDRTVPLEDVPAGYRAMDRREALKVLVRP